MSSKGPLLRGVAIYKDEKTGKECQAACALRWDDVDMMQLEASNEGWEYSGPITCVISNGMATYLLGKFERWAQRWEAHINSEAKYNMLFTN